ncbi:MAG: Gfo/Idh/MocA family oxidoreductase [Trueperaceae bacterium]|nr:Gfo/Idh/MocA family oxidoreductase [Trueperaceae bacterium]
MLNVGIIGAGDFGAAHARAIAQTADVRLVAASRTNIKALSDFCKEFACKGYTNYQNLLEDEAVEAVVVATPHHLHTSIVEAASRAGKHILLEKPMAPNLLECDRIIAVTQEHKVQLMLGHVNHFVPAYIKAKEVLESGELGELVYAHSTMTKAWMTSNRRDWHLDRMTGGGMWLTIGVHVLDQLCWLIDSELASISADIKTSFHAQEADDIGVALLRFKNGVSATASAIGYQTGVFKFLSELTCSKGLLKISHKDGVFIGRDERWQKVVGSSADDFMEQSMVNEWTAFRDALKNNKPMPVTGEFARVVMQAAFAAEASSREKREIYL